MGNIEDQYLTDIYRHLEGKGFPQFSELIEKKRVELGITDYQMSKILGITKNTFYRTLKRISEGDIESLDYFTIVKISQLFNIDVAELTKIYVGSLKSEHIGEIEKARKAYYILNNFDLKGLKDQGFIESVSDFDSIENRIVSFFHLNTIFDYSHEVGHVLFSKHQKSDDKMREFWVRSSIFQFEKLENPNEYDRDTLLTLVQSIRPYTRYEEKGLVTVIKALYKAGVTVIVQPSVLKAKVRGATFVVNGKPCIAITDFNDNYATLWFALMHELFHVLFDFNHLKAFKYHLTEDGADDNLLMKEADADRFAREMLFPQEYMNYIKHLINAPMAVSQYAQDKRVHPSIIYSFFCYQKKQEEGKNLYGVFQKYFGKTEKAVKAVKSNPFDKESIFQEIENIKQRLLASVDNNN
ncbi:transporter [Spirosoma litoris]